MIEPCDICGDIGFVEDIVTCFECKIAREHRLSKAIVPESVTEEDVPMSSTSITSESVCTSPPSHKPVDQENEKASKSNTSETLNPEALIENQKILGSACKQAAATVGNVKKSLVSTESEHLVRNLVSGLDQLSTMETASKSSPTRLKVASAKASIKKFKASHDHRKVRDSSSKVWSTTPRKAIQTSKTLKGEKAFCMHLLMIEAFTETDNSNVATLMISVLDEETSATYEKETHDTNVLGEKIETSQSQQRDGEDVSPEGSASLPVNTIASTLTKSDLEKIAMEYHIDTNRYHLSLPKSSERANSYFPCKHTFCIYADAFKAGLRLPLHPLISEILSEFSVAPTQIPPNSWRVLICFISFCYSQKITPTVNLFRAICSLKDHSGESNKGWWFFSARIGFKLFEGFPSSIKGWRHRFFIIRTSERDTLGVNTKWGPPNSAANQLPTLSAMEVKSLDDLVAAATNNPPDIRVLLSEEALIQAGISSTILKPKGSNGEIKQRHSLSQSGLVRALQRKRAATESGKSALSGLPCQEPILIYVDQEDLPESKRSKESLQPMEQTNLLQPKELTNRSQEISPPVTSPAQDIPHEGFPLQASPESNIRQIAGVSVPAVSSVYFNTATDNLPPSNAEVRQTGSVEYTMEQSVFTHPALARKLISQMVLPHDCDSVAQKDTLVMAQELMCLAMEDATWKMAVSEKLIKMQHEINMLKEERNALGAELESQKMAVAECESTRKTTLELQRLEEEVERLEIRLKETEEKAWTWEDQFIKLERRLKQAENRAASAERKVVVAEEKWRQSEMTKSRVAEETLKNFKASEEFRHEVEDYHAEAYGMGLNVAIEKIKRQFPNLDLSIINFYSED
ncbi:Bromodomain adjacent to zinc finger domain 1A [Gossypium australe]|uniref:Bromodomain adjacent to zinc finger domain 1A n=1 Tax=Gossypium australe TaxID=47621 RepID=A0A5B6UWV8_9ROSI|nr:Bromodomain adjacent to zinc finger domain 1A [Gossypium australe]